MRGLLDIRSRARLEFLPRRRGTLFLSCIADARATRSGRSPESTAACFAASRCAGMMFSPNACASAQHSRKKNRDSGARRASAGIPKKNVLEERDRDRRWRPERDDFPRPSRWLKPASACVCSKSGPRPSAVAPRLTSLPGGEHIDNCQHVTLGCCTNLEDFYSPGRRGKSDPDFLTGWYLPRRIWRRVTSSIAAVALPPPLHMAPSFAFFPLVARLSRISAPSPMEALLTIARSGGRPAGSCR